MSPNGIPVAETTVIPPKLVAATQSARECKSLSRRHRTSRDTHASRSPNAKQRLMSIPRDHHFVPVFYLRQWAPTGNLIEYSRPKGQVFRKVVAPRGTGYERDLYSFSDLPADIAQFLESVFLSQNDYKASRAMRK